MRVRAPAVLSGTGEHTRAIVTDGDHEGIAWFLYEPPTRDRDGDVVTLEFCPDDQFAWIVETP